MPSSALDQKNDMRSGDVNAGVELAAAAKGIAASNELQPHGFAPSACRFRLR